MIVLASATLITLIASLPLPQRSRIESPAPAAELPSPSCAVCTLGTLSPQESVDQLFQRAVSVFYSAEQQRAIPLFSQIISELTPRGQEGGQQVRAMLVDSLAYRARAVFNTGDEAAARSDIKRLLEVDGAALIPTSEVSPRFLALFDEVKADTLGTVQFEVSPGDAHVSLDGTVVFPGEATLPMAAGTYMFEVSRRGYGTVSTEAVVTAGRTTVVRASLVTISDARRVLRPEVGEGDSTTPDEAIRSAVFALPGDVVLRVTLPRGATLRNVTSNAQQEAVSIVGELSGRTVSALSVDVVEGLPHGVWEAQFEDIRRIERGVLRSSSIWPGFLIGAGTGAAAGYLIESSNPSGSGPIRDDNGFVIGFEEVPRYGPTLLTSVAIGAGVGVVLKWLVRGNSFADGRIVFEVGQ